jgi:hypothetical protein
MNMEFGAIRAVVVLPRGRRFGRYLAVAVLGATTVVGVQVAEPATPASADPPANCRLANPDPVAVTNEHEGATNYTRYRRPLGVTRAAVLFVDFPDRRAAPGDLEARRKLFVDPAAMDATEWLAKSSYGRASLQVTFTAGFNTLPEPTSGYAGYGGDFTKHRKYMQHAVTRAEAEIDFTQIDVVYVVPPSTIDNLPADAQFNSVAFVPGPGFPVYGDGVACFRPGVLVYVVDSSVGGGNRPITVLDGHAGSVANCGAEHEEKDNATLVVADPVFTDPSGVRVDVTRSLGNNQEVRVTW